MLGSKFMLLQQDWVPRERRIECLRITLMGSNTGKCAVVHLEFGALSPSPLVIRNEDIQ